VESLQCFPDLLANFNGRRKEEQRRREWVKHGWRNNGRQERDGGRKGKGIDHRWSEWKLFHCISLDLLTSVRNPYNSQTDMHLIPSVGL